MNLEPIVNARFLRIVEVDASAVLAGRKQSAMPETETEAYSKETEKKDVGDFDDFWNG